MGKRFGKKLPDYPWKGKLKAGDEITITQIIRTERDLQIKLLEKQGPYWDVEVLNPLEGCPARARFSSQILSGELKALNGKERQELFAEDPNWQAFRKGE